MDRNPQAEPMAHESMVRNLAAQAEAIWPQESLLVQRYDLPADARILDVGCGPGEILLRLARELPRATLVGIDLHEPHLELGRERARALGRDVAERVELRLGDAFALDFPDRSFDLVLCRHVLQAVPEPQRVLAEMARVTRRGGRVHAVVEDYGMIHCHPCDVDDERFWREGPVAMGRATGTDLHVGRKSYAWLRGLGLTDVRVDWVIVDTVRVERRLLVQLFEAWRDGYVDIIAEHGNLPAHEVRAGFDAVVKAFGDPDAYGVWMLPVVSGRVP